MKVKMNDKLSPALRMISDHLRAREYFIPEWHRLRQFENADRTDEKALIQQLTDLFSEHAIPHITSTEKVRHPRGYRAVCRSDVISAINRFVRGYKTLDTVISELEKASIDNEQRTIGRTALLSTDSERAVSAKFKNDSIYLVIHNPKFGQRCAPFACRLFALKATAFIEHSLETIANNGDGGVEFIHTKFDRDTQVQVDVLKVSLVKVDGIYHLRMQSKAQEEDHLFVFDYCFDKEDVSAERSGAMAKAWFMELKRWFDRETKIPTPR